MLRKSIILNSILYAFVQVALCQNAINFVNTGAMHVASSGTGTGVSLYIPDAMRHLSVSGREVSVVQNGTTELGGDFYQDTDTHIFVTNSASYGTSSGVFRFSKDHGSNGLRKITTLLYKDNLISNHAFNYIAFPNIEISTNDSIELTSTMGMDATSIHKKNGKAGQLILRSRNYDYLVNDASLRITSSGLSEDLVDAGSVIVERDMTRYRPDGVFTQLFGFATPFKNTQLSGYFAGNWVRRPLSNGLYGHTTYVYGNKDTSPADNIIDGDQYVYLASEKLRPSQAYLIKPRPKGFDYTQLQTEKGLWYTNEQNPSLYDKSLYSFDGKVYQVPAYKEQIFTEDALFCGSVNSNGTALSNTVNWLIGNSYTCPLSISKIIEAMYNSELVFSPYIYIFPPGATTFEPVSVSVGKIEDAISYFRYDQIAGMGIFMLRLAKGVVQNGSFCITKDMLEHGNGVVTPARVRGYRSDKDKAVSNNQITFRISPVSNSQIFDAVAFGFRDASNTGLDAYDIPKASISDKGLFQLYFQTPQNTKLSSCGFPPVKDSVMLYFEPSKDIRDYKLTIVNTDQTKEGAWLYDKKLNKITDISQSADYQFESGANDAPDRFQVVFKKPGQSEGGLTEALNIIYHNDNVYLSMLLREDVGNSLSVYGINGIKLLTTTISSWPEFKLPLSGLAKGAYIIEMKGSRNINSKFLKTY